MLLISSTLFCLHKAVVRQVVFPRELKQRIFPAFDGAFFLPLSFSSCAMQRAGVFILLRAPLLIKLYIFSSVLLLVWY